jgi:hypothetical protein
LPSLFDALDGSDLTMTNTFEFVSPGGGTDLYYDPPESRGRSAISVVPL